MSPNNCEAGIWHCLPDAWINVAEKPQDSIFIRVAVQWPQEEHLAWNRKVSEWAKEIRINSRRKCGHVIYCKLVPYGLPVFLRHCKDVVERTAHSGLDRTGLAPLRAKHHLSERMFLDTPFPLPQQELNVVLKHNLRFKSDFQQRDGSLQEVAEEKVTLFARHQSFCC